MIFSCNMIDSKEPFRANISKLLQSNQTSPESKIWELWNAFLITFTLSRLFYGRRVVHNHIFYLLLFVHFWSLGVLSMISNRYILSSIDLRLHIVIYCNFIIHKKWLKSKGTTMTHHQNEFVNTKQRNIVRADNIWMFIDFFLGRDTNDLREHSDATTNEIERLDKKVKHTKQQ